jgi:hypothetical protein
MQSATGSDLLGEVLEQNGITEEIERGIDPVTLVIALPGRDCVVVGSDTYAFVGDEQGYVGYQVRKIKEFSSRWIIGSAETNIGSTLLSQMEEKDFQGEYQCVLDRCRNRTSELYSAQKHIAPTSLLLCGLQRGVPAISTWHLPRDPEGRTMPEYVAEAIGIPGYGLQLANAYHQRDMGEE